MRWPKIAPNWQLSIGLMKSLALIFAFGGTGLAFLSLIAISITSGILAINIIINKKVWLPLGPMLIGVEIVLLVIAGAMIFFGSHWAWWGLRMP